MFQTILKSFLIIAFSLFFVGAGAEAFWGGDCSWGGCWDFDRKGPDLKIDYSGYYNKAVDGVPNAGSWSPRDLTCQKFFNFNDLKPGDFGEGTISLHLKNKDAWGCAEIKPTKNDDHGSNEPELEVDERDRRLDRWDGELAENLEFRAWADVCDAGEAEAGDNIFQPDCDRLLASGEGPVRPLKLALADSGSENVFSGGIEPLKKNQTYFLGVDWKLPASVGNEAQTDSYQADISFSVIDSKNNRNFRCEGNGNPCGGGPCGQPGGGCQGNSDCGSGFCQGGKCAEKPKENHWDFSDFFNFCWLGRCSR